MGEAVGAEPFRRWTDPVLIPVGLTASSVPVPMAYTGGAAQTGYNAFFIVNPNACFVRLKGFNDVNAAKGLVTATTGWLFPPGFAGVFGTQYPSYMSAMAFDTPAYPLANISTFLPLEISYGQGS